MAILTSLTIDGTTYNLPKGTTAQRPASPVAGMTRFNTTLESFESYDGVKWITIGSDRLYPGATPWNYATSGYELATRYSWLPSGYYWIKSGNMPTPLQMYVDMTQEGGGFDFYVITGGIVADRGRQYVGSSLQSGGGFHSGIPLGLDRVYPRSPAHWLAMFNFIENIRGENINSYFVGNIGPIYRETGSTAGSSSGNYTSQIMRNTRYYGSGAFDWRVPDGGRWWLRDTTYSEPNGDYAAYGHLGNRGIPRPYTGQDQVFNDLGNYTQTSGTVYLVSTNAKP